MGKVQVEAVQSTETWRYKQRTGLHYRIYANVTFQTSGGEIWLRGDPRGLGSQNYMLVPLTLNGNKLAQPDFELDTTEDSPTHPDPRLSIYVFAGDTLLFPRLLGFAVPVTFPNVITLEALEQHRDARRGPRPSPGSYDTGVVENLIARSLGLRNVSSINDIGMAMSSFPAVDPAAPVHVSVTDPSWSGIEDKIPTVAENAALQGTSGNPGDLNRFVTDEDPRVHPATTSNLGISELNIGAASPVEPKVVGANDTRLSDARVPTGPAGGSLTGNYPNPPLAPTGVVGGSYKATNLTVNTEGRIIEAASGLDIPQPGVGIPDGTLASVTAVLTALINQLQASGFLLTPAVPLAPTNLDAVAVSANQIDLSWVDNSADEDGFKIERKVPGGVFAQIDTVAPGVTAYSNVGLAADTTYVYRVRAYNGIGNSAYSNVVNQSTIAPPFAPVLYHSFFQPDDTLAIPNADTGQPPVVLEGVIGTKQYAAYVTVAQANSRAFECGAADGTLAFQIISPGVTQGFVVRSNGVRYLAIRVWNSNFDVTNVPVGGGGVTITSGSLPHSVTTGDWYSLLMDGPDFTLLQNGIVVATFNSAVNQLATQHGIYIDGPDPNTASKGARIKHLLFTLDVPSAAGSIQIVKPASFKVFQRNGGNVADIAISGTFTGAPTSLEARLDGGAWETISDSPSGGTFTGTLSARPVGQGWLEMRFGNDHAIVSRIPYVGIGDIFVIAGQSNAEGRISTAQFYTHATLRAGVHDHGGDIQGPGVWREAYDPTDSSELASPPFINSPWPLLATRIMAAANVPVAFITTAHGQTGFFGDGGTWSPPNGNTYLEMINAIQKAETGGVKAILWYQGESDARGETNEAGYIAALESLRSSAQATLGISGLKLIVAQLSNLAVAGFTRATLDPIRQAQVNAAAVHPNILVGPILYDLDTCVGGAADCIHISTPAHAIIEARRWAHMLEFYFYGDLVGRGPVFLSTTRVDPTHIDVEFTVATPPLLPAPPTDTKAGWRVINSDTQAVLAIVSALRQTGTVVRLTMAAALPANVQVSWASFNDAVNVVLSDSDADAMPAEPFVNKPVL